MFVGSCPYRHIDSERMNVWKGKKSERRRVFYYVSLCTCTFERLDKETKFMFSKQIDILPDMTYAPRRQQRQHSSHQQPWQYFKILFNLLSGFRFIRFVRSSPSILSHSVGQSQPARVCVSVCVCACASDRDCANVDTVIDTNPQIFELRR